MTLIVLLFGFIIVSLSEVNTVSAQANNAGPNNCLAAFSTDTVYRYRYSLGQVPAERAQDLEVSFTARANNDVHISLSPTSPETGPLYEIVIGGWGNTQSVIRRCKQCTNLATFRHSPLSPTEARSFVVSYRNGRVSVFAGDNLDQPFMEYVDPNRLDVRFVGYSTGWGSTGDFVFDKCRVNCHTECSGTTCPDRSEPNCLAAFSTNTAYYYRYSLTQFPAERAQDLEVSFTARANNDVHISLSPTVPETGPLYEIVIGGWGNTQSVIRRCKQCTNLAISRHSPLSPTEARSFVVSYRNGRVSVFTGDNLDQPFMEYVDPSPLDVSQIGYSTGWGSTGEFVFRTCDINCDTDCSNILPTCQAVITTDTTYYYRYSLPQVPADKAQNLLVSFTARARNDAHISLAPDRNSRALYEIVIGGWGNTQSVIRRCKQCTNLVAVRHTPLSPTEDRLFSVSYRNGRVAVYAGDNHFVPFMEYVDPSPLNIGQIGFSTGWGSTGQFVIDKCSFNCI